MNWEIDNEELYELGKELITPEFAAINLQVDYSELISALSDRSSRVHQSYFTGYLKTKRKHHKAVMEFENTVDENKLVAEKLDSFETQLRLKLEL